MLYFMRTRPFYLVAWKHSGIWWISCRKGLFLASFISNVAHFFHTSLFEVSLCLKIIPYSVALSFSSRSPRTLLSVLIRPSHWLQEFFHTRKRWQLQLPHDRPVFLGRLRQHTLEGIRGHAGEYRDVDRGRARKGSVRLIGNPW